MANMKSNKKVNVPVNDVVNVLVDAITASGKKFNEITKQMVFDFLQREGIDKSAWDSIYKKLDDFYHPKSSGSVTMDGFSNSKTNSVDYSDNSHNNVKVRQPRKSVFSEVVKIAG